MTPEAVLDFCRRDAAFRSSPVPAVRRLAAQVARPADPQAGAEGRRGPRRRACWDRRYRRLQGPAIATPGRWDRPHRVVMITAAREVHLVEYPDGEVTPAHFVTVDADVPRAGPGSGARAQHVHLGRPRHAPTAAGERTGRLLQLLPAQCADGRHLGGGRGDRVTGGGLSAAVTPCGTPRAGAITPS